MVMWNTGMCMEAQACIAAGIAAENHFDKIIM